VDSEKQVLVLRTTNKKFFKRWGVDPLKRRGLHLEEAAVSFGHDGKSSTLLIRYRKPESEVHAELERERDLLGMLRGGPGGLANRGTDSETPPDCETS